MPKPNILITAGHKTPIAPYRYAVERAGGNPLVRLPGGTTDVPEEIDGLVIAGGASVNPARYDSPIEDGVTPTMDPPRDELEWAVLDQVIPRRLPVLAICRGLQVVNIYHGGSVHQELSRTSYADYHRPDRHRQYLAHTVRAHGGQLGEILGDEPQRVNSIHRQGVKRLGDNLLATVFAPDGLIEGIETADGQIMAVQWHPEELVDDDPKAAALFTDLLTRVQLSTAVTRIGS